VFVCKITSARLSASFVAVVSSRIWGNAIWPLKPHAGIWGTDNGRGCITRLDAFYQSIRKPPSLGCCLLSITFYTEYSLNSRLTSLHHSIRTLRFHITISPYIYIRIGAISPTPPLSWALKLIIILKTQRKPSTTSTRTLKMPSI
jgi:hypothetical protein